MKPALLEALLDLVYPRRCAGCGAPAHSAPGHLCWECRAALTFINEAYCERCGDPVEGRVEHAFRCSACVDRPPHFDRARSAVRYRGAVCRLLQAFKYGQAPGLRGDLTPLLEACVRTHYGQEPLDAVTFVPLHPRRERERTYNQSRLLADSLARALGLAPAAACLRRVRATPTQTNLTAAQRRDNVRGAFAASEPRWIEGRRLLLVDDVMTTGATVNECARVLKAAGAAAVWVATVARG